MPVKRYNSITDYYKRTFGFNIQKISIDAGFTCPNRDGTKGVGGCTYCNNEAFTPSYCSPQKSVTRQLEEGKVFFGRRYKEMKFLAYFQAYSNTYDTLDNLKRKYEEALAVDDVIGLVISTRPDCIDDEKLDYLKKLSESYYVVVEYGVESTKDSTLEKVNRQHSFQDSVEAILKTAQRGLLVGVHLILGLPGETTEDFISHAKEISKLPVNFLKLHQLQIIDKTLMAKDYKQNPSHYNLFHSYEEYLHTVARFMEYLNPEIILERFASESPARMLIAPKWGQIKNYQLVHKLEKILEELNTWQGKKFHSGKNDG